MTQTATLSSSVSKPLIRALQRQIAPSIPFWLMRQAGRYLPEYRALRQGAGSFLDLCFNPEWAAEVTLQPLTRFDMDAAILFSDILVIPHALGQPLDFVQGEGPKLEALQGLGDVEKLLFDDQKLAPVYKTVQRVCNRLTEDKTLIGFAGAPWTVACYMIQGYGDGKFDRVKTWALKNEKAFELLLDKITQSTIHYLSRQIDNGADVVQLFDSWAGLLPESLFDQWVIAPAMQIVTALKNKYPNIPVIGFPRGAGSLYPRYAKMTGVNGVGLDTQVSITWAADNITPDVCLQGNLDPVFLLTGGEKMKHEINRILEAAADRPFIFNLGHGVIKETPPEHVAILSKTVKDFQR